MLSFVRSNDRDRVFTTINLSETEQVLTFDDVVQPGPYTDVFSGETVELGGSTKLVLPPWGYRVLAG